VKFGVPFFCGTFFQPHRYFQIEKATASVASPVVVQLTFSANRFTVCVFVWRRRLQAITDETRHCGGRRNYLLHH
jgi:hypothetical protein